MQLFFRKIERFVGELMMSPTLCQVYSYRNTLIILPTLMKSILILPVALIMVIYIITAQKPVVLMHLSQRVQDIRIHYIQVKSAASLGTFKTRVKDRLTM